MLSDETTLQARFGSARPGLTLVAIEEAAVPVTLVNTEVLAQERKPLPLLNEFVLRFGAAGLPTVGDMAEMLGLERPLVEGAVAEEVALGHVSYSGRKGTLALTPLGLRTSQELEAVQPVQKQLVIAFDRLTWRIADYSRSQVITKRDAEDRGMLLLPAAKTARISDEDVTVRGVNALLAGKHSGAQIEILAIQKLRPSTHRYLPVRALIYADELGQEVEMSIVVDDVLSTPHDLAIEALGGAIKLGVQVASPAERPTLEPALEEQRVGAEEGLPLSGQVRSDPRAEPVPEVTAPVRGIGVFEHRVLLSEALMNSRRRLLIISPWIKAAVVDTAFLGQLEQRLRSGVAVHIAHGYGEDDSGSDARAVERLANLQRRFKDQFTFARLANTHAKVLIFDDSWISTSFNWLSFRGDPNRTYRMEEGTLVRIPEAVDAEYVRYVELIGRERIN